MNIFSKTEKLNVQKTFSELLFNNTPQVYASLNKYFCIILKTYFFCQLEMMNGNKEDVIFVVTCDTSNLYATTNYDKYLVPPFLKLEGPLQKDRSVANTVQNVIHFVNGFFKTAIYNTVLTQGIFRNNSQDMVAKRKRKYFWQ